jgi:hypothetical protein
VRFGILLTNQHPPGASMVERFADTIEQVRLARDLGFDVLVFGQHFLLNEYQAPQPAVAAARLAAEAGSMRIGITIYLLPLLNPVAVAEEAASFDVITGGRFWATATRRTGRSGSTGVSGCRGSAPTWRSSGSSGRASRSTSSRPTAG